MSREPQPSEVGESTYVDAGIGASSGLDGGLERLWAPYRSAYIVKAKRSDDPFLDLPKESDEDALIVARGETVFCVLNLYPYNAGHVLVVPYRQVSDYVDLTDEETQELAVFTKKAIRVLRAVSSPDAINIGLNLGRASGGSVPSHLHQHIVPRWSGDANFMTVMNGTKVLSQTLRQTRELLAEAWRAIDD